MSILFKSSSVLVIIFGCTLLTHVKTKNVDGNLETQTLGCGSDGDCLSTPVDCETQCGCDDAYFYNETTKQCVLNIQHLMKALLIIYDPVDPQSSSDNSMSANIQKQSETVFRGIMVAAIIFVSCALVCVISACLYCCRINYSDRILRGDVKALAKKLNRNQTIRKVDKVQRAAKAESCNVIVEEAGVFVY